MPRKLLDVPVVVLEIKKNEVVSFKYFPVCDKVKYSILTITEIFPKRQKEREFLISSFLFSWL